MESNILADPEIFQIAVSSVLNKNAKEFGKKHLTDGKAETCWNSDQGTPQFVKVNFKD